MNGDRKVKMLQHTQRLAFIIALVFIAVKAFSPGGAPGLDPIVLVYALSGVGANFGAFVWGNVRGDHGAKGAGGAAVAGVQ